MNKLRTVVLEDEWVARNFLVELIEESGLASVVGAVASADDAATFLATAKEVDVVFVDINLAGSSIDGFDFVKSQSLAAEGPAFVLATAQRDYQAIFKGAGTTMP